MPALPASLPLTTTLGAIHGRIEPSVIDSAASPRWDWPFTSEKRPPTITLSPFGVMTIASTWLSVVGAQPSSLPVRSNAIRFLRAVPLPALIRPPTYTVELVAAIAFTYEPPTCALKVEITWPGAGPGATRLKCAAPFTLVNEPPT